MHKRENVKWAPFNSVINGDEVLKEIKEKKEKRNKPILSEDQLEELERLVMESLADQCEIEIIFYKNNRFYKTSGIITAVDKIQKKLTINNNTSYYFSNILKIIRKST